MHSVSPSALGTRNPRRHLIREFVAAIGIWISAGLVVGTLVVDDEDGSSCDRRRRQDENRDSRDHCSCNGNDTVTSAALLPLVLRGTTLVQRPPHDRADSGLATDESIRRQRHSDV